VRKIRTYSQVANPAAEDIIAQVTVQADRLQARLADIRQVVVVASGKGGVGKSALTANLAGALAESGSAVGAVDADLNGPSLARMLAASGQQLQLADGAVLPARGTAGVSLISTDLLLPEGAPLRWRSPAAPEGSDGGPAFLFQSVYEGSVLRELIADVAWGRLDVLLIDAPPGTDKLDRLIQLLPKPPLIVIVATPSEVTRAVVARSASVATQSGARAGVVVNLATHVCEQCGHESPLFVGEDPAVIAAEVGLPLWGSVPFDRQLAVSTDRGEPFIQRFPDAPAAHALRALSQRLQQMIA
jgi:ATP-binding protein involved in chromosome partitioning